MPDVDKEVVYVIIAGTGIILVLASLIIAFVVAFKKRQEKHTFEKWELQSQFSQTLLQSQLEIQEQTLKNISQEIHDNIGQALTLAKLNLNTMPVADDQQEKVNTTKEIISKAISDLRDLGRSLNTDHILDMGLQKAIEYELGLISKSSAIKTDLQTSGEPLRIDKQKELILFRIVQEVLNNTLKHAGATNIQAQINYNAEQLQLSITDDGKGFDIPEAEGEKNGLGLRNMHNRAKLIGAEFKIDSLPGTGTSVIIVLPNPPVVS